MFSKRWPVIPPPLSICKSIYNLLFSAALCLYRTIEMNCSMTSTGSVTFVTIILFLNPQTSSLCLPSHLSDFIPPPSSEMKKEKKKYNT